MIRTMCCMAALAVGASSALAAPKSFIDDFQTVTTYNHQTFIDACAGTIPDWSLQSALDASTFYERGVRGGGQMRISNWQFDNGFIAGIRVESLFVGWTGVVLACPGEPALAGQSTEPFTNNDLCIYGGYQFNSFQITQQLLAGFTTGGGSASGVAWRKQYGADLKPGIAGVDDDGDGATDNDPICAVGPDGQPGVAGKDDDGNGKTDDPGDTFATTNCAGDDVKSTTVTTGVPTEYLGVGPDGCPGVCGVDDDGNGLIDISDVPGIAGVDDDRDGVTDEAGELQFDQGEFGVGDDSDDIHGESFLVVTMRMNLSAISLIGLTVDIRSPSAQFSLNDVLGASFNGLDGVDELGAAFYLANTQYNYAFCATGTVYGAQLWVGNDVGNVVETLGPIANTDHSNKAADREVALQGWQLQNGLFTPLQNMTFTTNTTFGDRFQVLEGNILPIVPQDRDTDGDVDGLDFTVFASCFNKSGNPPRTLGCTAADASAFDQDNDNDVDGIDFTVFASCFNKSGNPPRALGCIPDLTGTVPPTPVNDLCADASLAPLVDGVQIIGKITAQTTVEWGGDPLSNGNCTGNDGTPDPGQDLWYEYTPSCTGTATLGTFNTGLAAIPTGAISGDTGVAVFTACPPGLATLITCSNVGGFGDNGRHESLSIAVTSGVPLIVAVVGDDNSLGDRGQFTLDASCAAGS